MRNKSYGSRVWCARAALVIAVAAMASSCVFEFKEATPRPHGSVGAEVYRTVCMGLAAQAYPNDLTGEKFEARCAGTDATPFTEKAPQGETAVRALARYNALLKRRTMLVEALDATFDSVLFADDELRGFLAQLVPLYDGAELLPQVTRSTATVLRALIDQSVPTSKDAIDAFERMGARGGYRPLRLALGVARPVLEYPELDTVVATTLETLDPQTGSAKAQWQELLRATALDLATADDTAPDPKKPGTLAVARKLLFADDASFSGGRGPLYVARRDHRGVALATLLGGKVPAPFTDDNKDGLADLDDLGRLKVAGMTEAPTPFNTFTKTLFNVNQGVRDGLGRGINMMAAAVDICAGDKPAVGCGKACSATVACGANLTCKADVCAWDGKPPYYFDYINADQTFLAGVTRDVGKLLLPPAGDKSPLTPAVVHDFAYGLAAIIGEFKPQTATANKAKLAFVGPDTATGPVFDLVYALGTLLPFEDTDQFLQVLNVLLAEHENEVAGLLEAGLYIDAQADKYPGAKWEQPHEFWDDLIVWTQRVLKRPGMLEAMLRALATEESANSGPLIGNFMRYKDRVSYPKGTLEELKADGIEIKDVIGPMGADAPDAALAKKIQDHRVNVNFPCPPLPVSLGDAPIADCTPQAPHPVEDHRGIRGCSDNGNGPDCKGGCPAEIPMEGASCADAGGYGLCSYEQGSCVCDCQGGLCRGQATPTWTCGLPRTPGYGTFVDRNQADVRVDAEGQTNQSLFQRTAALVHDLHVPASLCNKDQALMKLYDPAGTPTESGLAPLLPALLPILGAGGALDPKAECAVLNEPQIVRFFSRAILGTAILDVKDPALKTLLNQLETLGSGPLGAAINLVGITPAALGRNEIMQRQSQLRGLFIGGVDGNGNTVPSPTPQAVARMVFGPPNPFQAHLLNLPLTRDNEVIVDLHRDTIFAWELPDPISGVSYYQALSPLLKAFDDNELYDDDGELVDGYLFGDLISMVHKHWSSRKTDATMRACDDTMSPPVCDEKAKLFAFQSNGMSYEDLAADALLDAKLMARIRDVMVALDKIELTAADGSTIDGITVLANATRNLLDPERSCGPMGCEMQPLAARNKQTTTKTNTGKEVAQLTPAHLLFDALNNIDKTFVGEKEKRLAPWREARSQLVDLILDVERPEPSKWQLKNPRARAVLINVVSLLRDRLATYKKEEEACLMGGGSAETCQQRRAWSIGLTGRLEKSLGQPVTAATLRLLDQYWKADGNPGGELLKLLNWVSKEQAQTKQGDNDPFDTTLLSVTDMLQVFEDTTNVAPVMRFLSTAVAPNALTVATAGGEIKATDLAEGSLEKTLELIREIKKLDKAPKGQQSVLTKLMRALATVHGKHGETPLEVILDSIAEVNRAAPGPDDGKALNGADLRAVLFETQDFLSNERHGIERLYHIIQERKLK